MYESREYASTIDSVASSDNGLGAGTCSASSTSLVDASENPLCRRCMSSVRSTWELEAESRFCSASVESSSAPCASSSVVPVYRLDGRRPVSKELLRIFVRAARRRIWPGRGRMIGESSSASEDISSARSSAVRIK